MNAPDKLDPQKFADLLALTREPFPASSKTWLQGAHEDLRVPMREVALTNGERVTLYDQARAGKPPPWLRKIAENPESGHVLYTVAR